MKTYEAIFNPEKTNVYSISLVDDPATKSMFVTLTKQEKLKQRKIKLAEVNKEEKILMGIVLIPDQLIYRKNEETGEEFNLTFPKETIKESAHHFIRNGFQLNSKLEHQEPINGISFVESWIIKDPNNDKANTFDIDKNDIVEGAWAVMMKCDNEDIYQKAKNGEINGFSIDGMFGLKEVKLNKHSKMEEKTILEKIDDTIKTALSKLIPKKEDVAETEVKLGSVTSVDGMVFMYDGETPEPKQAIWIMGEDGETRVAVPVGDYPLEGGGVLVVKEEGIIDSVGTDEAPAALAEPEAAPAAADAVSAIKSLLVKFTEDQEKFRVENQKAIDDKLKAMDEKLVEFSAEPAAKPIKSVPVSYSDMSNVQRMKHNREN